MKAQHPLMPFIYNEAVRLFKKIYQVKSSSDFVVLDCAVYSELNGYTGRIQSLKHQNGQYTVAVNNSEFTSVIQMYPHYMEPLYKVKDFGITNSGAQQNEETVSLPNLLSGIDKTTPQITITIKFYWKQFELTRKRFIRPENTQTNHSTNALLIELSKVDDQVSLKNQRNTSEILVYNSLQYNFSSFTMPFQVNDNTLFKSGSELSYFSFDNYQGTALTNENWDNLLHTVFAEEGTLELNKTSFATLTPGQSLDSSIIDLCLKW
jgi:hypothetical protein